MFIKRHNPRGKEYTLEEMNDGKSTLIKYGKKEIMVSYPLELLNQSWYNWTNRGDFVQHAFAYLTVGEREFLISGLLEEEFEQLFKDANL